MMRSKNLFIKILIVAGLLLAASYLLATFVFFSANREEKTCNSLNVKIINNDNIKLLSEKHIADFLRNSAQNPIGKKVSDIKPEKIEEELLRHYPTVKNAECYTTPSGVMQVVIGQRTPKFRVLTGGDNYYVDTERKTFPVSIDYTAYVPVISGRLTKKFATEQLFDFVDFIERNKFWNAQIEQIYVADNKHIELVPRVGNAVIYLGELSSYENKLAKLQTLYTSAFNEIGWNRFKIIDLRFQNQVVCTKIDE